MTTNSNSKLRLHRRERRAIPPFGNSTTASQIFRSVTVAFDTCLFAPFPNAPYTADRTYFININESDEAVIPRFAFTVDDVVSVTRGVGVNPSGFSLSVSVRSGNLKRYVPLTQWRLNAVPETWCARSEDMNAVQGNSNLDFVLAIRVATDCPELKKIGLDKNTVLARREFTVKRHRTGSFPIEWVDFEQFDYPRELLWIIQWKDPEDRSFSLPVHEVLTVWVNQRADIPLQKIAKLREGNNLGWKMLAAEITTEIWCSVLKDIEELPNDKDTDSLAGHIFANLARVSDLEHPEIKDLADDDYHGRTIIRSYVSKILKVVA